MRLTKIVCTLGPASLSDDNILALMKRGMNVARINFSHGNHQQHGDTITRVQKIRKQHGFDTALMLDTKGPEIRTGDVVNPIAIKAGEQVLFTPHAIPADAGMTVVQVNYKEFGSDAQEADEIIVDNGDMYFDFIKKNKDGSVVLKARQPGNIGSRRHINLPGSDVSLPSMAQKDWDDLDLGVKLNMDYIALSFIRTAKEVEEVKAYLKKKKSDMKVISKIETRKSVANIDSIIEASDGIMVARGDLGSEMPFQKIPAVQDMIVAKCRAAGKPVIVATQMLESMIKNPTPTRAEVTDVAHAVTTRADSTMLSGETAAGKYPLAAVEAMTSIQVETEKQMKPEVLAIDEQRRSDDYLVRAKAAATMAVCSNVPAIVILCQTGRTVKELSALRPQLPILAFSDSDELRRELQLYHGVITFPLAMKKDPEANAVAAMKDLVDRKILTKKDRAVVVSRVMVKGGPIVGVHLREAA